MLNRLKRNRSKLLLLASGIFGMFVLHLLSREILQVEWRTASGIATSVLAIPFFLASHRITRGRGPLSRYFGTFLTGVYGLSVSVFAVTVIGSLLEEKPLWTAFGIVAAFFSMRMFLRAEKDAGETIIEDDAEDASGSHVESSGVRLRVDEDAGVESEPVQEAPAPARNRKRKRSRRKG